MTGPGEHIAIDESLLEAGARARERLEGRSVVLIGMMGAGKSSVGRRLSRAMGLPFVDADTEIENAARMPIPEIFAKHGEAYFRDGERRVVSRLLEEQQIVLATGGGAFMDESTREKIKAHGISIWLKADLDVLLRRVKKRGGRPLLKDNPEQVLRDLLRVREPVYSQADITLVSGDVPQETMVAEAIHALQAYFTAKDEA